MDFDSKRPLIFLTHISSLLSLKSTNKYQIFIAFIELKRLLDNQTENHNEN